MEKFPLGHALISVHVIRLISVFTVIDDVSPLTGIIGLMKRRGKVINIILVGPVSPYHGSPQLNP